MGIEPDVGTWLAAFDDAGEVVGVARITETGGVRTIDDVWVDPAARRAGIGSALLAYAGPPLWLICDDDMISFYEQRGFALVDADQFPKPLATFYGARGEWPQASDHVHHAMVKR